MAMGIVNKEDLDRELESNNRLPSAVVKDRNLGRGKGTKEVPDEVKKMVAELSLTSDITGRNLADLMGVSESSVSAYKVGATSTKSYNEPSQLTPHVNGLRQKISFRAQRVLRASLKELTPERIAQEKPHRIADIAGKMATIVHLMEPKVEVENNDNRVQFVMFAPVMKQENSYDAIDVQALDVE